MGNIGSHVTLPLGRGDVQGKHPKNFWLLPRNNRSIIEWCRGVAPTPTHLIGPSNGISFWLGSGVGENTCYDCPLRQFKWPLI